MRESPASLTLIKATQEVTSKFILQPKCTNNPQNICEGVITNSLQRSFHAVKGEAQTSIVHELFPPGNSVI